MKTSYRKRLLLLSLLPVLAGCGDDDEPKFYLLDRLRVIAITASQPEVAVGTAGITLTPVVSDPNGGGRVLSISAEACVDPGVGYGATPSCEGNPTRVTSGTISVAAPTFTPGAAPHYTGNAPVITVDVPASGVIFANPATGQARTAGDQYNGVAYLVRVTVSASATETITSFKRIIVSTRPGKNAANPTLTSVLVGGVASTAPPARPTSEVTLEAQIPAAEEESYLIQESNGSLTSETEEVVTTWFVSSGELRSSRTLWTDTNKFTPASGGAAIFFGVVVRDSRGGVTVQSFTL